jgi:predicted phosphoribosyltransferase
MSYMRYADRREAGRLLAEPVAAANLQDPVVLGLPRGGVVVAAEVAARLGAPLDIVLVRKLGAPHQPELAIGAVVDGDRPVTVLNDDIVRATGASERYIEREVAEQLALIDERRRLWLADRHRVPIAEKTAIVVDDGIATGATVRAALRALRQQGPRALVVAAPVAAAETVEMLRREADRVICLQEPSGMGAIGFFYFDFRQVSDDEVTAILRNVPLSPRPHEGRGPG